MLVIPATTIERVAARLASDGRIRRGYLGLGLHPVALTGGGAGAMVMSVDPKGLGAAAGVHQGDVIVALSGEPIRHVLGEGASNKTIARRRAISGPYGQVSRRFGH